MRTVTWKPNTYPKMDQLFEELRDKHYNDHSHRLWKNYSKKAFTEVAALSIYFDENDIPEVCSSITNRNCWPKGAYRIHNRVWKCNNKKQFLRKISPCIGYTAKSQIEWLKENTDCKLYFISRQTDNWDVWMIERFKEYELQFNTDNYMYLTCPDECDETCWQRIIYCGDENLLEQWKRK